MGYSALPMPPLLLLVGGVGVEVGCPCLRSRYLSSADNVAVEEEELVL